MKFPLALHAIPIFLSASLHAAPALAETDGSEHVPAVPSAPAPAPAVRGEPSSPVTVSGYLQSQYEHHLDSEDQLRQGGKALNLDRFLVRRARLRLAADWEWAGGVIEFDGNTTSGGFHADLYRAEAKLHYRPSPNAPALVEGAIGAMTIPFGFDLVQSSRLRPFMERSLVVRSLFPSPVDLGARVGGTWEWLHWTVAAMNGEPKSSGAFAGGDPNGAKDLVVRVGVDTGSDAPLRVSGNVSFLGGKGFHAGTDATKSRVEWRDLNEDGIAQQYEYTPVPGRAATPSKNFDRWAVGADVQLEYVSSIGSTWLLGEMILAQNLDRHLFQNDPVETGLDARGFGWYVAAVQELGKYAMAGFRFDSYDPDANSFDSRRGKLVPRSMRIDTFSPMVGLVLPDIARLTFQYDFIRDHLARDEQGLPADLANDAWTLRLQVNL
ncbi:MAG TPA: hypothetical protein VGD74_10375 [Vulgatibacter sp.]